MKRIIFQIFLLSILLFISFSCSKKSDEEKFDIKEGTGTVWLSGGLAHCAFQIRMVKGDTLIPVDWENEMKLLQLKAGADDVFKVKYREIIPKQTECNVGKDCEIIEIKIFKVKRNRSFN